MCLLNVRRHYRWRETMANLLVIRSPTMTALTLTANTVSPLASTMSTLQSYVAMDIAMAALEMFVFIGS